MTRRLTPFPIFGLLLVVAFACAASGAMAQGSPSSPKRIALIDRIVAVVNNEVITKNELDDRIAIVERQLRQGRVQAPPRDVLERQVLERMVSDRAQLQLAKETGIKVDDLQVDRAVERIAEANRMSLSEFRRAVERDGVSYDKLREDLRVEVTLQRLREREVDARIQVSESEIDNFLAEAPANAMVGAELNVAHVLVRVPEGATSAQLESLQAKAQRALDEVRKGADFGRVAVAFSDAPDGLEGGGMGWRPRERLPELYVDALDRLSPGEVSGLLRSPAGFHIVKLVDRRSANPSEREVEQTRVRHVLVRTNETVSESEARRRIGILRQRIVQGADFAEVARFNSEDASAARGGELGWVFPGDTVPEFEAAMKRLREKELSEPVRTPFGWHLIEVLERRTGGVTSDRRRLEARKALRDRKADEAYEEWLRQLRDQTYVELRLEER